MSESSQATKVRMPLNAAQDAQLHLQAYQKQNGYGRALVKTEREEERGGEAAKSCDRQKVTRKTDGEAGLDGDTDESDNVQARRGKDRKT